MLKDWSGHRAILLFPDQVSEDCSLSRQAPDKHNEQALGSGEKMNDLYTNHAEAAPKPRKKENW